MKKKNVICIVLALFIVLPILALNILAAGNSKSAAYIAKPIESRYFYDQLNERAKAIYDKLLNEFTGSSKANYYSGTQSIDLIGLKSGSGKVVISQEDVTAYIKGNKDIFNDFSAAKDALDLDHSELWYIDSGYLSFRVTQDSKGYHVLVGPGRGPTYLLGGQELTDVGSKITAADAAVKAICDSAVESLNKANSAGTYTQSDKIAALVTSVHDQVIHNLHYRYEIECSKEDNAKYIRTVYGIVTHEGVCEAYARTMQVCLSRLGIECVLVHGLQTKGTPEDHMWNAVNIPDNGTDRWYVVDATWDDPLVANWDGTRDLSFHSGEDGRETNTYLLVGQLLVGEHWRPSGYVSTGNFKFKYPTIESNAYSGATVLGDNNGLKVDYSSGAAVDGAPAGVFSVTYQGMDAKAAREKGLYFIVKMYDYHPDGTADVMNEWYYADATFIVSEGNPYFGDYNGALRISTATCEYVEIAVTTREPDHRSEWTSNPSTSYLSKHYEAGYFHGDESEIIAQSGMLYNVNSTYEAPPYVLTQTPAPNGSQTAGYEYRVVVTWDDDLSHPMPSDLINSHTFTEQSSKASRQQVRVRYTTIQQDLHTGGDKIVQVAGELPFDKDRDGYVDMDGSYTDFKWIYKYADDPGKCPNAARHTGGKCDVDKGCAINGVEFNFRGSDLWIDDVTEYSFSLEGVVGSRSSKFPNNFAICCVVPGLCPACYRSQGIDWNLWGQPTLLDAPDNLDLLAMAKSGGTDKETLDELDKQMKKDDINGRLMLVVEDKSKGSGSREEFEKINEQMEKASGIKESDIISSSVFEINFNRICPMVKLKPNKGQSLRVQVGYPAGVTYESLGSGEVELKAFHFTRCDANNKCAYYNELNHKDGEHILSVEEITVIPTPYGMVIMCDAFSPFEIVAVKGSSSAASAKKTLVVVEGENGSVYVDGKEAVGANGNVSFTASTKKTFTVKPDAGYVVDTVALGGVAVKMNSDGKTFTIDGSTLKNSDVLTVTFLPDGVKKSGEITQLSAACTHPEESITTYALDGQTAKAPTCTEDGFALGTMCTVCGTHLTEGSVIPALGHIYSAYTTRTPATCTEAGTEAAHCERCNVTTVRTIPALGHAFASDGLCQVCGRRDIPSHEVINDYYGFKDVPSDEWYVSELEFAYNRGLIYGDDTGCFNPDDKLTRGQTLAFLARFDGADGTYGDKWLDNSRDWALSKGIITDGSGLDKPITREELATMLWLYFGKVEKVDVLKNYDYTDVDKISDSAVDAFNWAVDNGIILGETPTELCPQNPLPRKQMATVLSRFVRLVEG